MNKPMTYDIELFEDWFMQYSPQDNHLDSNASFNGCMYETYGQELEYVKTQPDEKIWTLIEEDGQMFLSSGFHLVNRVGYFICKIIHNGSF